MWHEKLQALVSRLDAYVADSSKTPRFDDAYDEGGRLAQSILKDLLGEACSILREIESANAPDVPSAAKEVAAFVDRTVNFVYSDNKNDFDFLPSFAHAEGDLVEDPLPSLANCGAFLSMFIESLSA